MKSSIELKYGEKIKPDFSFSKLSGAIRYHSPLHWHDSFEIIFIESGSLSITVAGKDINLTEGDVAVIPPCVIHGTESDNGYASFFDFGYSKSLIYSTDISFENMRYLLPFYRIGGLQTPVLSGDDDSLNRLRELLLYAMDIHKEDNNVSNLRVRAAILEIHALIISILFGDTQEPKSKDKYLEKTEQYILDHISEDISPYTIADELYVSYSYLAKRIKDSLGCSIGEMIVRMKLNFAEDLMLDTNDLSITDIARRAGFSSPSYFARCFKRIKGTTPRQFKKMLSH